MLLQADVWLCCSNLLTMSTPPLLLQTGMPMTGLAAVGAQYRLKPEERAVLQQRFLPWALRAGTNCHDLMTLYYEHHIEVRAQGAAESAVLVCGTPTRVSKGSSGFCNVAGGFG